VALLGLLLAATGEGLAADDPVPRPAAQRAEKLKQAAEWGRQAFQQHQAGHSEEALRLLRQALDTYQRLYPPRQFPNGHPDLIQTHQGLSVVLLALGRAEQALPHCRQALEMSQRFAAADKSPRAQVKWAQSASNQGAVLAELGQTEKALPLLQQALTLRQQLYPTDTHPDGHAELALSLYNLGGVLGVLGQTDRALALKQQALEMRQRLYSAEKFPRGHPDLATSLHGMGTLLQNMGQADKALPYYQQALQMRQRLHPAEKYPRGHPDLANSLHNLGAVWQTLGRPDRALTRYQQALQMRQRLYPADQFHRGHPALAISFNNLGSVLHAQGQDEQALAHYQQAVEMYRKLYPRAQLPQGHPHLAGSLHNLGVVQQALGQSERAVQSFQEALEMFQTHLECQAATTPEAQALDLLDKLPPTRNDFLSLTRQLGTDAGVAYAPLWLSRAALTRLLQQRQEGARLALDSSTTSAAARQRWQRLQEVRCALSALPERAALPQAERDALFRDLSAQKEDLERQLARELPQLRPPEARPTQLSAALPRGVAFIDFFHYFDSEKDRPGHRYVAFVLSRDQPIRRVELGEAGTLNEAIDGWLHDVSERPSSVWADRVGARLWPKLAQALVPGTHTLYLAPEGHLSRLPWAALPTGPQGVLLESHRLAVVPHGPFLLEQLQPHVPGPRSLADDRGRVLAVGGVHDDLPATKSEVELLCKQAAPREVLVLGQSDAAPARVLKELSQVRVAHLATHGFFEAELLTQEQLRLEAHRQELREKKLPLGSGGRGLRNPLIFTGLVLAPDPKDPLAASGRVTGEILVSQPLQNLRLCVLSACETGLGKLTGGEGVMGLQRAFHLAGCPNVVASLWKVNDEATAALMAVFYDRLWHKGEPPLEALRQAQLTLYYHPERISTLARERGPKLKEAVDLPLGGKVAEDRNAQPARTKLWAAFVLSGVGR
jgi:CHAT domain-containing protein/tetratricopeptide (TPR) repeat protein